MSYENNAMYYLSILVKSVISLLQTFFYRAKCFQTKTKVLIGVLRDFGTGMVTSSKHTSTTMENCTYLSHYKLQVQVQISKNPLLIEVNIYSERSFPVVYCRYVLLFENVFLYHFFSESGRSSQFYPTFPKTIRNITFEFLHH